MPIIKLNHAEALLFFPLFPTIRAEVLWKGRLKSLVDVSPLGLFKGRREALPILTTLVLFLLQSLSVLL